MPQVGLGLVGQSRMLGARRPPATWEEVDGVPWLVSRRPAAQPRRARSLPLILGHHDIPPAASSPPSAYLPAAHRPPVPRPGRSAISFTQIMRSRGSSSLWSPATPGRCTHHWAQERHAGQVFSSTLLTSRAGVVQPGRERRGRGTLESGRWSRPAWASPAGSTSTAADIHVQVDVEGPGCTAGRRRATAAATAAVAAAGEAIVERVLQTADHGPGGPGAGVGRAAGAGAHGYQLRLSTAPTWPTRPPRACG